MEKNESEKAVDILYDIIWDYLNANPEKIKVADAVLILEQVKYELIQGTFDDDDEYFGKEDEKEV